MVLCKYFQEGNCRFGTSCRFQHAFSSKYTYQAPDHGPAAPAPPSLDQFIQQSAAENGAAIKGGQWLLSCYSPFKGKPCFPGLADYSMEEVRLMMYEAKNNGTLEQTVAFFNQLYQNYLSAYKIFSESPHTIKRQLESLFNGVVPNSPFQMTPPNWGGTAGSTFASPQKESTFAMSPNVFGNTAPVQTNVFGGGNVAPSDLFASASSKMFGPAPSPNLGSSAANIFAAAVNTAQGNSAANLFASANQNIFAAAAAEQPKPQSVFAQSPFNNSVFSAPSDTMEASNNAIAPSNPFKQSVFAAATPTQNPQSAKNIFQSASASIFQSPFGTGNRDINQESQDDSIYSREDQLTAEDLESYNSDVFVIGKIPEVPPTYALCCS